MNAWLIPIIQVLLICVQIVCLIKGSTESVLLICAIVWILTIINTLI